MKKILIILGHPAGESFNELILKSYHEGAIAANHEVHLLRLDELKFDLISRRPKKSGGEQKDIEPDLEFAQQEILWADHLVFIYPLWWGNVPALLKGFIDRSFISGFSHRYLKNGRYEKLLKGRSAHLIITMDAPTIFEKIILHGSATTRVMKQAVLQFCGITPVKITRIGLLRQQDQKSRKKILEKIKLLGNKGL